MNVVSKLRFLRSIALLGASAPASIPLCVRLWVYPSCTLLHSKWVIPPHSRWCLPSIPLVALTIGLAPFRPSYCIAG
ncbi:hypothetical protein R3P38DRAFT_2893297 [Favolaschia claudopus]|uniref:Secreted protein n=1 Tax=Favolaschia claudopus TaxID=2862362 RepID=A0AAW0CBK1_9AGAR